MIAQTVLDSDVLSMVRIEQEAFAYPWSEDEFYYWIIRDAIVATARTGNVMQGYVIAMPSRKRPNRVRIVNIAVHSRYRGQGVGRRLVEMIDRDMRVGQELVAYVHEYNDAAVRFFAHIGFRGTGVKQQYYELEDGAREDAWIMKRPIMREIRDADCTGRFLFEEGKR